MYVFAGLFLTHAVVAADTGSPSAAEEPARPSTRRMPARRAVRASRDLESGKARIATARAGFLANEPCWNDYDDHPDQNEQWNEREHSNYQMLYLLLIERTALQKGKREFHKCAPDLGWSLPETLRRIGRNRNRIFPRYESNRPICSIFSVYSNGTPSSDNSLPTGYSPTRFAKPQGDRS